MDYKQMRKILGVLCGGTLFSLSGLALMNEWPQSLLKEQISSLYPGLLYLAVPIAVCLIVCLPFDMAGYFVARRYKKEGVNLRRFLMMWFRGVSLQSSVMFIFTSLIFIAGKNTGYAAAYIVFFALSVFLYGSRRFVMHFIRGYKKSIYMHDNREVLTGKKTSIANMSMFIWNSLAFTLATQLPDAGVATINQMLVTILGFSCFSMMGWLWLPLLSRRHSLDPARLALYLSWAGGNVTARAVCTNVGRPHKWVYYK